MSAGGSTASAHGFGSFCAAPYIASIPSASSRFVLKRAHTHSHVLAWLLSSDELHTYLALADVN